MISIFFILLIITFLSIEINHYFRQDSPLVLKPKEFKKIKLESKQKYIAWVEIRNLHKRMEVMIPSFNVNPQLIGISKDKILEIHTKIKPHHPEAENKQKDDYWPAYILKGSKSTLVEIEVGFEIKNADLDKFKCLWLDIEWSNYGPFGSIKRFDGFVLPNLSDTPKGNHSNTKLVDPIKTHILGTLDDPINILKYYIPPNSLPTDILTIGESPLAIMQGKYIDYRNVNPSRLSILICKGDSPTVRISVGTLFGGI